MASETVALSEAVCVSCSQQQNNVWKEQRSNDHVGKRRLGFSMCHYCQCPHCCCI